MDRLDPHRVRADVPILAREVNGRPLVYLDWAASSPKPRQVLEAMDDYYRHHHANVHRGAHTLAAEATAMYEAARGKVARFLGAPSERSVVFVRNTTEAINLVAHSWGRANLRAGDRVVVTVAEHHANLVPWNLLAEDRDVEIVAADLDGDGRVDLDHLASLLDERTRLVAVAHMGNVLGQVNPVRRIADLAHAVGARLLVDGAQAAAHLSVDVTSLGADFYALSGHKMCGPTGAGALWAREEVLEAMPPFLGGGEMIRRVEIGRSTYAGIPARFEAGTPAIAEAVGLGAAVDYLESLGMERVWEHDRALARYALDRLEAIEGVAVFGPRGDDRGGIVPFTVEGAHPHDVATFLDEAGIAVRAGHHCAQPLARRLGVSSTVRASVGPTTTEDEIDRLAEALVRVRDLFAPFGAGA